MNFDTRFYRAFALHKQNQPRTGGEKNTHNLKGRRAGNWKAFFTAILLHFVAFFVMI
jgi:hypothetical protein